MHCLLRLKTFVDSIRKTTKSSTRQCSKRDRSPSSASCSCLLGRSVKQSKYSWKLKKVESSSFLLSGNYRVFLRSLLRVLTAQLNHRCAEMCVYIQTDLCFLLFYTRHSSPKFPGEEPNSNPGATGPWHANICTSGTCTGQFMVSTSMSVAKNSCRLTCAAQHAHSSSTHAH